jgi:hypothetical protein
MDVELKSKSRALLEANIVFRRKEIREDSTAPIIFVSIFFSLILLLMWSL